MPERPARAASQGGQGGQGSQPGPPGRPARAAGAASQSGQAANSLQSLKQQLEEQVELASSSKQAAADALARTAGSGTELSQMKLGWLEAELNHRVAFENGFQDPCGGAPRALHGQRHEEARLAVVRAPRPHLERAARRALDARQPLGHPRGPLSLSLIHI